MDFVTASTCDHTLSLVLNSGPPVPVEAALTPGVLSPRSEGRWVSLRLGIVSGASPVEVDPASIRLGVIGPGGVPTFWAQSEGHENNANVFKFPRTPFEGLGPGTHLLRVAGCLVDGRRLQGSVSIEVLDEHASPDVRSSRSRTSVLAGGVGGVRFATLLPRVQVCEVYDVRGRLVSRWTAADRTDGTVSWDGRDVGGKRVAPGLYFLRASAGKESVVAKVVMLR
jgi:hypothetical protein